VSVTGRVPFLSALGVTLTVLAYLLGWHLFVFVLMNVLLVGLILLDFLLTPKGTVFSINFLDENGKGDCLYFKTDNNLSLSVRNHSRFRLWVQALGYMGDSGRFFKITDENMEHTLNPGEEKIFSYSVIPTKRGSFAFESVFLRYRGVLGFCVKYTSLPAAKQLKVYPNVRDLSKFRLMMQKNRLLPSGEKIIRQSGIGTEFESLRSYVEGDDYRKINWPATAREGKLIVNQYQIERNQPVYILIDTARPMSYSVNGYKKLDYAINAALVLSDIVNQQGDQTGLMAFDEQVNVFIKPGKGPGHRNLFMETLYQIEGNRQTADYEGAFKTLNERQKRRSLVFIFTDFEILEEAEELIANITILKKRHLPIVVFMANEGLNTLAEAPASNNKDKILRETALEFQAERKDIFRRLNYKRIPNVESNAENFAVSAVNRYLQIVKR
jgi:uncharacterized protein (DUF58 family)